ncbi:hypothetical protein KJ641_04565 [Patescibacteria group bacterium]|nr:hypothetical protein [Patescibacteria group bacterium]MBU1896108.1 hypothetical protein [Patescibacteria group bacterium]
MKKVILYIVCFSFILLTPVASFGVGTLGDASGNLNTVAGGAGVDTSQSVGTIVGQIIKVALTLVGLIFLVLTVYAGFMWMTARGEPDKVEKAKKIISSSLIGMFIVVTAYAITALVTGAFS